MGPLLDFIGSAARVLFGLLLAFVGGTLLLAILVSAGVVLGVISGEDTYNFNLDGLPWEVVQASLPVPGLIFTGIVLVIPALLLVLTGAAVVIQRPTIRPALGWSALGIWLIGLAGLSATMIPFATDFRQRSSDTITETVRLPGMPVLTATGSTDHHQRIYLQLRGHADSTFQLKQKREARGSDRERAQENARLLVYEWQQRDSTLSFPTTFALSDPRMFRAQELGLTLYIPYDQPFVIDQSLTKILRRSVLYRANLSASDLSDNTFAFTQDGLNCLSCNQRENLDDLFPEIPSQADSLMNDTIK